MRRKHFLLSLLLLLVGVVSASAQTSGTEISRDGWSIKGSSFHPDGKGYGYNSVLDGNTNTYWHSNYNAGSAATDGLNNTMPQWILIDLGQTESIKAIGVQRRSNNNHSVKDYKLYVSDTEFSTIPCPALTTDDINVVVNLDNEKLVKSGSFGGGTNNVYYDNLETPVTGRYVLFVVENTHANENYVCMSEFMLYNDAKSALQKYANKLQALLNVAPVGTTFGHYSSGSVTAAQEALEDANGVLSNTSATETELESVLATAKSAYETLESSRVGYGELYIIKNTGDSKIAIYNSGSTSSDGSAVVLSNWSDYDRRSFFKLDVAQIVDGQAYFTIRAAVDETQYVYAINKDDANSNVGVKAVTDGALVDDMLWKFVANGSGWNIIPKGGSNGWNCRGYSGGNNHIGQWNQNNNANNIWRVESTEEFILAEKVTPYAGSEGKIGGIANNIAASTEAAKALAASLRTTFTDADLTAYKNFAPALKTPGNGLYKIYNKGTDLHLYSEETANNVKNVTLGKKLQENAKYYWNVTFDGNNATIIGSTGLSLAKGAGSTNPYNNITANYVSPLTLQPAPNENAWTENYFVFPNVHSTKQNHFTKGNAAYNEDTNPIYLTTFGSTGAANQYTFEPVTLPAGAEIYTVEIRGAEGGLTYNNADYEGNATVYNGGFYVLTSKPSASDFTALAVSGRTPEVTVNGNCIAVNYVISDGVMLYSPNARASALKTDGTKYMIYNATSGRYGMYHNNGSNNIQMNTIHPSGVKTLSEAYLFTFEAETNDEGVATGKYYIKSVSGNTYFNINGTINNASPQALNIKEYSTSTHKPGTNNFTGDNGGTAVAASAITAAQKFWAVETDVVSSQQGCWNGNAGAYTQWGNSHALAFYEVNEVDANTELADEIALLDETLAKNGVGYPVQEVRKTLDEAIIAAQNNVNAPAAYTAAINTYKSSTNVQMPEEGKAYTITNVQKDGTKFQLHYTETDSLTIGEPNPEYNDGAEAAFICKEVNGKYVFVFGTGKYLNYKGAGSDSSGAEDDYNADRQSFVLTSRSSSLFGSFTLCAKRDNNTTDGSLVIKKDEKVFDGYDNTVCFADNYSNLFILEEVSYANTPAISASIDDVFVGTFSAPFPAVVPEGVSAYEITGKRSVGGEDYISCNVLAEEGQAIPAGTGVLLVSSDSKASVTMLPRTTETVAATDGNLLVATGAEGTTVAEATTAYILANGNGGVGFYLLNDTDRTIGMNKAYLAGLSSSAVLKLNFGGNLTGIDAVDNGELTIDNAPVYDLSGRVVANPTKGGVYIKGGKKYIVK